ncbi:MAG: TIGR03618 family F420-dependent PPOX class oxidoreductase [Dactylosporangium sp.]|nr:TIGR03618 family F420-dependent PPOX class oxidoreductase [Dactylosporangium sp.]NNJ62755.1 TIGR03618 family F420-dependent PPOX class oxidoreductase [Dactylosporangium sp.]
MVSLPGTHVDLLDRPLPVALTTEMPNGRLQSTVVWCNRSGDEVLLNTMREFQKARNLQARPRATVLVLEPEDANRWIEVRGTVTLEDQDALAHLGDLTRLYLGTSRYFGGAIPAEFAAAEHPVRCRLAPTRVVTGPLRITGGRVAAWRSAGEPSVRSGTGRSACRDEALIPDTHRDLVERPLLAAMSTRLPGGAAQVQPVWCLPDGNDVLVNTTRERRKGRNLAADPRATLLVIDPDDSGRWLEIRGDVELTDEGAEEHLDRLTEQYTGQPHYYGTIYPQQQRVRETRVIVRIHPRRVNADALHR